MASIFRKIRKLARDPIAYCLDSKHPFLQKQGGKLFDRQREKFSRIGAANAHRKISVIMTAYNTSHLVEAAVESVLAQTHKNFELMVIDDASNDDTLDVLKALAAKDQRIRIFHSPVNHGTYWSKNWCLSQADGEFVAFHDSDDRSDPMRLQVQLGAMLEGDAEAVTCHWRRVDAEDNPLIIDGAKTRLAAISLMIRRQKVLDHVGFFDSVRISADSEFIRRIYLVFGPERLRHIRHVLYTGLLRDESLTRGENSGFIWATEGRSHVRELSGDRAEYRKNFLEWHNSVRNNLAAYKFEFPMSFRRYDTPEGITRGCDDPNTAVVIEASRSGLENAASESARAYEA